MGPFSRFLAWMLPLVGLAHAAASTQLTRGLEPHGVSGNETIYRGSYALLIGAEYMSPAWPTLPSIGGELAALRAALESHGFQVTVPPAAEMDGSRIRREVLRFISRHGLEPDNRVLIFFAGHGYTRAHADRERGYLVPSDAPDPAGDVAGFVYSAISMDEVHSWAKMIESKHALFVFDSCFSGSIFHTRGAPPPRYLAAQLARPVRQFLTAGSASETVPAESVFLPLFVRGLSGEADGDCDGFVTATEIYSWVSRRIADYEVRQTPQFGRIRDPQLDQGEFLFPLPRPAAQCAARVAADATLQQKLDEEFWAAISGSTEPRLYRHYLARVREGVLAGKYTAAAEAKLKELERVSSGPLGGGLGRIAAGKPAPPRPAFDTRVAQSRLRRNLAELIATSAPPSEALSATLELVGLESGTPSAESNAQRVLQPGDPVRVKVTNVGTVPARVALFLVDSAGGVLRIHPNESSTATLLHPQAALESQTVTITDGMGTEEVFLIAVDSTVNLETVLVFREGRPGDLQIVSKVTQRHVARVVSWFASARQIP